MPNDKSKKKNSHMGKALLAGAVFGLAAGIFMSSKEGKKMAKNLQTKAKQIEKQLLKEFKKKKEMTESAYEEAIDTVLEYYVKSRKLAKTEIPALRKHLLSKWKLIKSELSEVQEGNKKKSK
ncbi:hypothetical protein GF380_01750 [Candidatus Uhrbacteria bacterium]|nr:hypothetical protein [Candidatus Uhrbacteria bacterium]MBD3283983.1 hypothetical protein [Candidatus Uhrbacteria bacterium]